jgi:site-specific recombinase XerD
MDINETAPPAALNSLRTGTETVKVYTRHTPDCPRADEPQWRRCNCRKYLYVYRHGKDRSISAKTRSWERAERKAREIMDSWDPVRRLQRELEQQRKQAEAAGETPLEYALDRWVESKSKKNEETHSKYRTVAKKMKAWARTRNVVVLADVTTDALDEWRSQWSPTAKRKYDQIGKTTQGRLLERIKGFFRYAVKMKWLRDNPALELETISAESRATLPLLGGRYEKVLAATHAYDAKMRADDRYGAELRALIELMRWSGLRVGDALMCPRSRVEGNHLFLRKMKKTGEPIYAILPDRVLEALRKLPPRTTAHPNYFFWTGKSKYKSLVSQWERKLRRLNDHLQLVDYERQPMKFHSHQLRDTFAVEHLLHGTSLEDVSKMLGHSSITITEEYYAPWVPERRARMESRMVEAMRRMGVAVSIAAAPKKGPTLLKRERAAAAD